MPPVYADSFGGITQAELGYANLRERALSDALNRFVQTAQSNRDFAQRADVTKKQLEMERDRLKDRRDYYAAIATRYEGDKTHRDEVFTWQKGRATEEDKKPTASQARSRDRLLDYKIRAAETGDDPGDLASFDPEERSLVESVYKTGRKARMSDYESASEDAKLLTRRDLLQAYSKEAEDHIKKGGNSPIYQKWTPGDTDDIELAKKNLEGYQKQLSALNRRALAIEKSNEKSGRLVLHPKSGRWIPTMTPPTDEAQPSRSSRSYSPHDESADARDISYVPPIAAPGAPLPSRGQAMRTAAPPSRYTPGRRYGNLRYLGGDPNVESSWAPVR